ncbi:MAG: hypothetical protein COA96_03340 [SAR86 cluster bacterium]|uniref:Uncharacterized protein n=1 Tax=SAR86 cluster bacterium TaxID=2030880 RepID=A0A2A5B7J8_9GAMM|nr:MAG: hypothetical protein COA96_03340 [SAR86 cluster bacterium]
MINAITQFLRLLVRFAALLVAVSSISLALAQNYQPSLTEHGVPDFTGVWNFSSRTPFERPERYGDVEFLRDFDRSAPRRRSTTSTSRAPRRPSTIGVIGAYNGYWNDRTVLEANTRTSLIIHPANGRIPPVQDGVTVQLGGDQTSDFDFNETRPVRYTHGGIGRDGPEDRGLSERCLVFVSGPPLLSGGYNNHIQIFQNADHIVLLVEMGWDARIVNLSNKPYISDDVRQWSGDSRGYIEGNTLVVETRNFTTALGSLSLRSIAYGTAKDRVLTERFTLTTVGTMDYEFTIDDPTTFTDKIVAISSMTKVEDQIFEYACHPGNYAMKGILQAGRMEEANETN